MSDLKTTDAPMALQVAVRVERDNPPSADQAAVATALATIALLEDDRSNPDGPWHEAVERWNGARIRKIVRRARGSAWNRIQDVGGVTVCVDGVEARAFVPSAVDEVPKLVARLQIQSTALEETDRTSALELSDDQSSPWLSVAVTPEVEMSWGKRAAQCAHAAQRAWITASQDRRQAWTAAGRPLIVINPDSRLWSRLVESADVEIRDGGFTEIPRGTRTTVAHWVGGDVGGA